MQMLGCANGTAGSGTETGNPFPSPFPWSLICEIAPFLLEERQASLHIFSGKHRELLKLRGPRLSAIPTPQ